MTDTAGGPELDLSFFAGFKASIDTLGDELRNAAARQAQRDALVSAQIPTPFALGNTGTGIAGVLYIGLGKPQQGRRWELRRLWVGGSPWYATPASTGVALLRSAVAPPVDVSPLNIVDFTTVALPWPAFYGTGQIITLPNEHLFVAINGTSVGVAYNVVGMVLDYPMGAGIRTEL